MCRRLGSKIGILLRSSLIYFAAWTVEGATPMQAKWIKLDLDTTCDINNIVVCDHLLLCFSYQW